MKSNRFMEGPDPHSRLSGPEAIDPKQPIKDSIQRASVELFEVFLFAARETGPPPALSRFVIFSFIVFYPAIDLAIRRRRFVRGMLDKLVKKIALDIYAALLASTNTEVRTVHLARKDQHTTSGCGRTGLPSQLQFGAGREGR